VRKVAKTFLLNATSFFIVSFFYPGIVFENPQILLIASLFFGVIAVTIKPILKIFSLPLNLFTFGLFSFLTGIFLLYLVGFFIEGVSIAGVDFPGINISGFEIPSFFIIPFLSALLASVLISWLSTIFRWIFH